jgi:hypothetical protein
MPNPRGLEVKVMAAEQTAAQGGGRLAEIM